jgi:hypothetical protein
MQAPQLEQQQPQKKSQIEFPDVEDDLLEDQLLDLSDQE